MDARVDEGFPDEPTIAHDPPPSRSAAIVEHHLAQAGRMAQFLVHELNNQLTGILGFAQVLQIKLDGAPEMAQLDRIVSAGEKMQHLIESYREITHQRVEPEPVQLGIAVQGVIDSRRYEIEKRNIVLILDVAPDLPTRTLNPGHLYTALGAIIDNAYDALKDAGGGTLTIGARTGADGTVEVEVSNSAGSLSQEPTPWQTTKDSRLHAGIGLAVACWIAEALGGSCTVTGSPTSDGVRVLWTLPPSA